MTTRYIKGVLQMVYTPREIAKQHPTHYKTRRQLNTAHNQELRVILSEEGSRKYFMDNGMIIRGRTYTRILHLEEPQPLASLTGGYKKQTDFPLTKDRLYQSGYTKKEMRGIVGVINKKRPVITVYRKQHTVTKWGRATSSYTETIFIYECGGYLFSGLGMLRDVLALL